MKRIKDMFNVRLYLEGLKRLKVIGIASSITVVGICALVPIVYMISNARSLFSPMGEYTNGVLRIYTYDISIEEFAVPLILMLFIAPFFVSSIFSYLNHRNESDFYHAIPYKRTCVFNLFMLSAVTWVFGIIFASVAICGILWGIIPKTSYDISILPLLILATFAACLILMCFMALAKSLTGTMMSNLFIFGILASFMRIVFALFSHTVAEVIPIWQSGDAFGSLLKQQSFFPIALLGGYVGEYAAEEVYSNFALYIYTVVCSIAIYVLAAYIYNRRRSEMAGNSAPTKRLQHVYRIAFTTPFVLLLATYIVKGMFSDSYGMAIYYLIFGVLALFVYYLYELITTRSPKSMLKSTPYLLVLVAIGGIYVGGVSCMRAVVLSNAPEADEISYVVLDTSKQYYYETRDFEDIMCEDVAIYDSRVIKGVSSALEFSIDKVKNGTWEMTRDSNYQGTGGCEIDYYQNFVYKNVKIKLKNGQTIHRRIKMYEGQYGYLMNIVRETDEYLDSYLKIPKIEQLSDIAPGSSYNSLGEFDWKKLYSCYSEEYDTLSIEDKKEVKKYSSDSIAFVKLYGKEWFEQFTFRMNITVKTPKTLEMFSELVLESYMPYSTDTFDDRILVRDTVEDTFNAIHNGGDVDGEKRKMSVSISAKIYDCNGNAVGEIKDIGISNIYDSIPYDPRACDLVDALYKYRGEYSPDKYIVAVSITYPLVYTDSKSNDMAGTFNVRPIYFVDAEFKSELSRYVSYKYSEDVNGSGTRVVID